VAKFFELTFPSGEKFLVNPDYVSNVYRSTLASRGLAVIVVIDGKESTNVAVQESYETLSIIFRRAE